MKTKYQFRPAEDTFKELLADPEFAQVWQADAAKRELTKKLIKARIERQMTQQELSKATGLKQSAVSRFERGGHIPTTATLAKIAAGLGMKLEVRLSSVVE